MKSLTIKTAAILFIMFAVHARAFPQTQPAASPATLRFVFTKGDVYDYAMKMEGTGKMKMTGLPDYAGTGRNSFDMPIDMSSYMEFEIQVADTDKTGAATLTFKITSMKIKQGAQTIVDTKADADKNPAYVQDLLNKPFTMKIAPDGTMINSDIPSIKSLEEGAFPTGTLEQLMKNNWMFLPSKPVVSGDKWSAPLEITFPWANGGKVNIDYSFEMLGFDTMKQLNCAVIGITNTTDFRKQIDKFSFPDPSNGRTVDMKLDKFEQTLDGKIYFSPKHGIFVGSHVATQAGITGTMEMPGGGNSKSTPIGMNINFNIEADVELQ